MARKNRGALLVIAPLVVALALVWIIYGDPFHIFSSDPQHTGNGFANVPVWLWVIGVAILGSVMAYGISQARRQTHPESNMTQTATSELYRSEETNRKRKGLT
jgi:cytochrome bd-type quinol oxidase subunit 2